jgi:hypothetical protein
LLLLLLMVEIQKRLKQGDYYKGRAVKLQIV